MKVSIMKGLALCGLCAILANAGSAALSQADFHGDRAPVIFHGNRVPIHQKRPALLRQKAAYVPAVANRHHKAAQPASVNRDYNQYKAAYERSGDKAAQRAQLRARTIRQHVRGRHAVLHKGNKF